MNPRPHAPKARALPSCATLRQERSCPFFLVRLSQARVVLYRSARGLSTGFLHFFARFSHLFSSSVQIIRNICVICSFHISIFPSVRFILLSFCTFSAGFLSTSMLLYRLNPFSLPLNLHKARHFCPCKQFYAVLCSQKGIRKFLCFFLCYHVK